MTNNTNSPPHSISIVRHVESIVHGYPTLSPWVITKVAPPGVPALTWGATGVLGASWIMVLLVIAYAHHIWHYCCERLDECVPLIPDVSLNKKQERLKIWKKWKLTCLLIQGVNSLKYDNSGWKAFSAGDVCYAKISACFYSYKMC